MKKIMVIDDEKVVQTVLGRFLKMKGYDVLFADDGLEGLEKTKRMLPDLVLLDIRMPQINGLSLCALLKKDKETAHIPIFFLSAEGTVGVMEDALQEGAAGYLTKPFDFSRLLEKIETLLH